ncbi:hypothetical protein HanPI659440_Chr13g0514151 [Helianthus annuus]|nr:hypothetical protein HanPI659440_Chr13g0514151 [Helianthus annuus]
MTSIFHTTKSLPLSQPTTIRHRISAIQPPTISSTTAWAVRSSKSVSSIGESASNSVKNWWNRGWEWILSRKLGFALDLEMNQEWINWLSWPPLGVPAQVRIRRRAMRYLPVGLT